MTAQVIHILRPVLLWSLHFTAIYALISAACAPRGLMETEVARASASLVTFAMVLLGAFWLFREVRGLRRTADHAFDTPDPHDPSAARDRNLQGAAIWSAAISVLAMLANLWPIAFLSSCTG